MRFTVAYYLLLLYTTVIFQSLIPTVYDTLSHAFSETYHLATVHAKYGSNHLEISMARADNTNNKDQNNVKAEDQASVHVSVTGYSYNFSFSPSHILFPLIKTSKLLSVFIFKHVPPPKFS